MGDIRTNLRVIHNYSIYTIFPLGLVGNLISSTNDIFILLVNNLFRCRTSYIQRYNKKSCSLVSFITVRKAKKNKEIHFFWIKNGITFFQKDPSSEFVEASHVNELVNTRNHSSC